MIKRNVSHWRHCFVLEFYFKETDIVSVITFSKFLCKDMAVLLCPRIYVYSDTKAVYTNELYKATGKGGFSFNK